MKKSNVSYSNNLLFILFLLGHLSVSAATPITKSVEEKNKVIHKSFPVSTLTQLIVEHHRGELIVENSSGTEAEIVATMTVKAEEKAAFKPLFDHFEVSVTNRANMLSLVTEDGIKFISNTNGWFTGDKTKIEFTDGETLDLNTEVVIDIEFKLLLPPVAGLSVENRYDDILLPDLAFPLNAVLSYGDLRGGNIEGDTNLDLKFAKANFGTFHAGKFVIFDSELTAKSGESANINTRYSKVKLDDLASLELVSFDDNITIGQVTGAVKINMKYSDLVLENIGALQLMSFDDDISIGNIAGDVDIHSKYSNVKTGDMKSLTLVAFDDNYQIGNVQQQVKINDRYSEITFLGFADGKMQLFDSELSTDRAAHLDISSKYTTFRLGDVERLDLFSFDDEFALRQLCDLSVSNSKHTQMTIENFTGKAAVVQSFEDKFNVRKVADSFLGWKMDSKYTNLTLPLPSGLGYRIDIEAAGCGLRYLETSFTNLKETERNGKKLIKGSTPGANDKSPLIKINSFSGAISL